MFSSWPYALLRFFDLLSYFLGLVVVCLCLFSCSKGGSGSDYSSYVPDSTYYPKPYRQPHSRRYSNPYDIPPRNYNGYYYPYYDSDQYYIPPREYYRYEQDSTVPAGADSKY